MALTLKQRAFQAAKATATRFGYTIISEDYEDEGMLVLRDGRDDSFLFFEVTVFDLREGEGFSEEKPLSPETRKRFEKFAAKYLCANIDTIEPCEVRFGQMEFGRLSDDRALLRHCIYNCE